MTEGGQPSTRGRRSTGRTTPSPNRPAPRRRDPRPLYKRGVFWLGVIVVEVVAAWIVTSIWVVSPTTVDLGDADLAPFCAEVRAVISQRTEGPATDVDNAARFQAQADTMARIRAVAPADLTADTERLQQHLESLASYARELEAQSGNDLSTVEKLAARLNDVDARVERSGKRVDDAAQRGCGIDLNQPLPESAVRGEGSGAATGSSLPPAPPGSRPAAPTSTDAGR